ncbi:unnamed protein product [Dimorphilus gyrociliatus]|uniref:Cleavage and polyadenylation specificity factor subunit 2 n=1 Tax=Dimorphilus gyrociliatus TaxID=2664684 RepID=A0A7I8WA96_9ANNE|nr:unnamed protein product [Dimorphilus gyrociliatus]
MTSIIRLKPFSGVKSESPPCYLLQIDECHILLDCGWDEHFSMDYLKRLKENLDIIDAVLISHPDPHHLGALPYLVGRCGLNCPIYATVPVYKMGQMFLYDLYQSRHSCEHFEIFTLDDVDAAFEKIKQLKYLQTVGLKGKGHGLQITPIPAGHMIGGTIWKIVKDGEEEIYYAIDFNHKKERHLNGCILDGIVRPHLFITDAFNANYQQTRRKLRDEQLLTSIIQTLRNDGNVLITIDTAGRCLELAHLLDQMWRSQESGLMCFSLAICNNVSFNVVEFAKSQVEWMADKITRAFEDNRTNPFQFKHLMLCHSLHELNKVPSPKVVLASSPDLESGFAKDLFISWSSDPRNVIILTNRTSPGTLARTLIDKPTSTEITVEIKRREKLEGKELEEYRKKERERIAEEQRQKALTSQKEKEESSDSEDVEKETAFENKYDLLLPKIDQEHISYSGLLKISKRSLPMFPTSEERLKCLKWDDYGEFIRPEDFLIFDEKEAEEPMETEDENAEQSVNDYSDHPTKCIVTDQTIQIRAKVMYIDFEGRTDGESMRKILAQIKPRQLILVHGDKSATENLANYCSSQNLVNGNILTPDLYEIVDTTTESHIFQVRMKDSLVSALQFEKTKDVEVSWIDAILDSTAMADEGKGDDLVQRDSVPTLIPAYSSDCVQPHGPVFINEPKLSELKEVIMKQGITAEFTGGVLVCGGSVAIKKNESGKLTIEGTINSEYYKIRRILYSQFAIV